MLVWFFYILLTFGLLQLKTVSRYKCALIGFYDNTLIVNYKKKKKQVEKMNFDR